MFEDIIGNCQEEKIELEDCCGHCVEFEHGPAGEKGHCSVKNDVCGFNEGTCIIYIRKSKKGKRGKLPKGLRGVQQS